MVTLEVAKQGAIYHGLATLLNQPSPMMQRSKGGRRGHLLHGLRLSAMGRAASGTSSNTHRPFETVPVVFIVLILEKGVGMSTLEHDAWDRKLMGSQGPG